jgi:two-component system phosphate regulon response regulator PhoB
MLHFAQPNLFWRGSQVHSSAGGGHEAIAMRKKVLVIDDEMVMRSLIAITMQRNGYTVVNADNSSQALDYLDSSTPDLIILDILMPGMNGLELCRRIRSRPATTDTPIIVFSALGDETTIKTALAAGANRYLHKLNLFGDLMALVQDTMSEVPARKFRHHAHAAAVGKSAV